MGSKRRNNSFWLPTTSNQTMSSCVYLQNKTNKTKNPASFQSARERDFISFGRRSVANKDRKTLTLTLAGHLPASLISGHCFLINKQGTNFQFSSVHLGGCALDQEVCALDHPWNSFFHLLDSIKDTKVWEKQVWPEWSYKGRKSAPRAPLLPRPSLPLLNSSLSLESALYHSSLNSGCPVILKQ